MNPNPSIKETYEQETSNFKLKTMILCLLYLIDKFGKGKESETIQGYRKLCGQLGKRYNQQWKYSCMLNEELAPAENRIDEYYSIIQKLKKELAELKARTCATCCFFYPEEVHACEKHGYNPPWAFEGYGCTAWKGKEYDNNVT